MSLTGYIKNLFIDKEKTVPLFPRTKVKAVSDDDGVGLNVLLDEIKNEITPMSKGGTEATDGATGLKNLFAAGETILSDYQYGPEKPVDGRIGQVFFEEATGTIADIGQDVAAAVRARNLLDNSDFTNPVNQRGAERYSGTQIYTIDRWKVVRMSVSVTDAGIIVAGNSETGLRYLFQKVFKNLAGKKITAAVSGLCAGAYIKIFDFYLQNELGASETAGVDGFCMLTCEVPSAYTNGVCVNIYVPEGETITPKWAALYEGEYTEETLPPYVPKGYGAEQLECRRYYQRSYESTPKTGGSDPIMIFLAASSYAGGSVLFPLEMRVTPTVTLYNPDTGNSGVVCDWSNSADVAASPSATRKGFQVRGGGRFTQGKYYGCHYEANADL